MTPIAPGPHDLQTKRNNGIALSLAHALISISLPVILVMTNVRLVMTPLSLHLEYTRPSFPADPYGLTTNDRLRLAPIVLEYLHNGADIEFLLHLQLPDGQQAFNLNELRHLRDVKSVTQSAFGLVLILTSACIVTGLGLARQSAARLAAALRSGVMFTFALFGSIILIAVLRWDMFFTLFHQLLFEDGTWQFAYSDTLIRLFPEQFWFDAALVIGAMTLLMAIVIYGLCVGIERTKQPQL